MAETQTRARGIGDGGRIQKRNAGSFQKLEQARKQILPSEPPEGADPAGRFSPSPVRLIFPLMASQLMCFKPLNLITDHSSNRKHCSHTAQLGVLYYFNKLSINPPVYHFSPLTPRIETSTNSTVRYMWKTLTMSCWMNTLRAYYTLSSMLNPLDTSLFSYLAV